MRPFRKLVAEPLIFSAQDLLAISPDGPKLIPFEYQLYLFDAIGSLVGTGSDQDQIAFLEVPSRPALLSLVSAVLVR